MMLLAISSLPPIATIVAFSLFKGAVGEKVAAVLLGGNILAFVYLLLYHVPLGSRLLTQDIYWIGTLEEFITTPVLVICAAVRSSCFQKLLCVWLDPVFDDEEKLPTSWKERLARADFTVATGLTLLFIPANICLLGALARASF